MSRNRRLLFIITFIIALGLLVLLLRFISEPRTPNEVNLLQTIKVPKASENAYGIDLCEVALSKMNQRDVLEEDIWPHNGILPIGNQVNEASITTECIRINSAIYSDEYPSVRAFEYMVEANKTFENTTTMYPGIGDNSAAFSSEYNWYPANSSELASEYILLILEKCNTVVTVSVMKSIENSETFSPGIKISDDEIEDYGKQIYDRIEKTICPLVDVQ